MPLSPFLLRDALKGRVERQKNAALRTYDPETEGKIEDLMRRKPMDPEKVPEPPGNFRPEPFIIGDQDFAKTTHKMLQRYPDMRGRISQIRNSPNEYAQRRHQASGIPLDFMGLTSLGGAFNPFNKQMYINPGLKGEDAYDTLLHEGRHAMGDFDDSPGGNPYQITGLANSYREKKSQEAMEELVKQLQGSMGGETEVTPNTNRHEPGYTIRSKRRK